MKTSGITKFSHKGKWMASRGAWAPQIHPHGAESRLPQLRKIHNSDINFFLELVLTLAMIIMIWGLLGGCVFTQPSDHPKVSLGTAKISEDQSPPAEKSVDPSQRPDGFEKD